MATKKTTRKKRPAKRVKRVVSKKTAPAKKIKTKIKRKIKIKVETETKKTDTSPVVDGKKWGKGKGGGAGCPNVPGFIAHQWKKGHSGHSSGRPKGAVSLTATLRKMLMKKCPAAWKKGLGLPADASVADGMLAAATKAAAKGDHKFFNTILERIDGKVPDIVHSTSTTLENFSEEELGAIIQNGDDDGDEGDGAGAAQAPGDGDGGDAEDGGSP